MGLTPTHRTHLTWLILAILFNIFSDTAGKNPYSPDCSPSFVNVPVTEPQNIGYPVIDLSTICTDTETITYNIAGDNADAQFKMVGSVIQANNLIDAEAKLSYAPSSYATPWTLRVSATDTDGNTTFLSVYIAVISINDNEPKMNNLQTNLNLPEDTAIGTIVDTCTLVDLDLPGSGHATPTVEIQSGNSENKFAIDPVTCALTLIDSLDYETTLSYSLVLRVYDNGAPPKETPQTVDITVQDVNDHAPTCSFYNKIMEVDEGSKVAGDTLLTLTCQDLDTGLAATLIYDRLSIVPQTPAYLDVDGAGNIILQQNLDYESGDTSLEIQVRVSDGTGINDKSAIVTAVFTVADVDDNPPVFSQGLFTASISESSDIGDSVLQLTATDADSPNTFFSQITYGWETACSEDWFTLDTRTGSIFVKSLLDYETAPQVTCQVFAYSSDKTTMKNVADVTINILDVNDMAPMFAQVFYEADITEGFASPVGSSVLTVTATDPDSGTNGQITYFLPNASPFTIDPDIGKLSVAKPIDYETVPSYLILVKARDHGSPSLESSTYINIKVLPVNEFAPSAASLTAFISENSPPGTSVLSVGATDGDAGDDGILEYYLRDTNVPFVIERETGKLLVGVGLDAETQDKYALTVEVRDKSKTTVKTSTVTETIFIDNENDNSPECSQLGPITVTPDTYNVGNILGTLSCTDGDGDTLTYTESSGDPNKIFMVDSGKGIIRLTTTPISGTYIYKVSVTDGVNTIIVAVEINVETKLNWSKFNDFIYVDEDAPVTTLLFTYEALGSYDTITYQITSSTVPGTFNLNPMTGELRLAVPLDREQQQAYTLELTASTSSGQSNTKDAYIFVNDINDNAPRYSNSYTIINVSEDVAVSTTLTTITARDLDRGSNGRLTYSIKSGNTGSKFQYDSSGNLIVASALDYETIKSYTLVLEAKDMGSPQLNGTTLVYIVVTNVDDNSPIIVDSNGQISVSLPEDTAVGAKVIHIDASDLDDGSDLVYEITAGNTDQTFFIDGKTGDIYLVKPLDRETLSSMSLTVQVTNAQGQTDTTQLNFTLTDVNDNDPLFSLGNYVFKDIPHNTPAGVDIGSVTVTDPDLGVNQDITLTILFGDQHGRFTFNGQTLRSAALLDANVQDQYELQVQAMDAGNPSRSSTAYITVLIDPEFKRPLFFPDSASITVEETTVPGTLNYDSDATMAGAKEHEDGDLIYFITSGNNQNRFYIETYTGTVQLIKYLSYAATSKYTLVIKAVNRYNRALADFFTLTITVTQVNKYPPVFTEDVYTYDVDEIVAVGTSVGQVIATDQDVQQFGSVTYTLEPNSNFVIDSATGEITVSSPLDYSIARTYNFYVRATDNAGANSMTGSSVVVFNVIDFNNHSPTFAKSSYTLSVPETTPAGETFYTVAAVDLDSGVYGTVQYTISSGNNNNLFSISSAVGTLTLNTVLDYETSRQHVLVIIASDGGSPSLSGTITLTINVLDRNDNSPVIDPSSAVIQISGDTAPLTPIYTVKATDRDSGKNGEVNYIIQSGNDDELFGVDTVSGVVKTSASLETASDFYTLIVIAVDQGQPTLTGTMTIYITVAPISSTPPGDYIFSVSEDEARDTQVGVVAADPSRTITGYTITGGNFGSAFSISMNANGDGVLVTNIILDRETYAFYQLHVSVQHSTGWDTIFISVTVLDKNDNAPIFDKTTLVLQMVENLPTGNVVGAFTVTDPDEVGPNSDVSLYIGQSSPLAVQFFSIDNNGVITVNEPISYEVFRSISFTVVAEDQGTPQQTSYATVMVSVIDVDETIILTPIQSAFYVSSEMPDDVKNGDAVYTVTPADVNITSLSGATVRYTTVDSTDSIFVIHSTAGTLTVNKEGSIVSNARYFQWVIVSVTSAGTTTSYALNIRLDTFNKLKHMVVIRLSVDAATARVNLGTFQQSLQAFHPTPRRVSIWKIQDSPSTSTARRRLLATDSQALVVVVADKAADDISNIDQPKTFLSSEEAAAAMQSSPPGSDPQGSLTGGLTPATAVDPYEDEGDDSLSTELIVLIVICVLAGIAILIGLIALIVYCAIYRRKPKDDKKRLVDRENNRSNNFGRLENSTGSRDAAVNTGRERAPASLSYGPVGENTVSGGGGPVNPGNMTANFLVPGAITTQTATKPSPGKGKINSSVAPKKAGKQPTEQAKPPVNQSEARSDPTLKANKVHSSPDPEADGMPSQPITATYVSSSMASSKPSGTTNLRNDSVMLASLEEEAED